MPLPSYRQGAVGLEGRWDVPGGECSDEGRRWGMGNDILHLDESEDGQHGWDRWEGVVGGELESSSLGVLDGQSCLWGACLL